MDPKLADLLVEAGIATPEQAEKLRRLLEEHQAAAWRQGADPVDLRS